MLREICQKDKPKVHSPGGASGKEPTCQCRRHEMWVQSLGQEDPRRRAWQPTPIFLPGESHGQRSRLGYSPRVCKESDMTKAIWQAGKGTQCQISP